MNPILRLILVICLAAGLLPNYSYSYGAKLVSNDFLTPINGTYNHVSRMIDPNGISCDNFGRFVTNGLILAATKDYSMGCSPVDLGKVYLFKKTSSGWTYGSTLLESDPELEGQPASVLAIDETRLAVRYGNGDNLSISNNIVTIYRYDGQDWILEQKISTPNPYKDLCFGCSAAMDGPSLMISAPEAEVDNYGYKGAIYFYAFEGNQWIFHQKITDAADVRSNFFGRPLVLKNSALYVGFPYSPDSGKVNIYQEQAGEWVLTQTLTSPNATYGAHFGSAVGVDGNSLVVGAMWDDIGNGIDQGSAFLFEKETDNWVEKAKFTEPNGFRNDGFGESVAISGETVVIGSPGNGAVYVFHKPPDGWQSLPLSQELTQPNAGGFGSFLYLDSNTLLISAPYEKVNQQIGQGAIHFFYRGISHGNVKTPIYEGEKNIPLSFILDSKPTAHVTISVQSKNPDLIVSPAKLTFTPDSWDQPQEFFIEAFDDCAIEGTRSENLYFDVSSEDSNYAQMEIIPIPLTISEKLSLMSDPMIIKEGEIKQNSFYLIQLPSDDVNITTDNHPALEVNPSPIIYHVDNPPILKFSVKAIDDDIFEGNQNQVLKFTSASQDDFFNNVTFCLDIVIVENDYKTFMPFVGN